MPQPVFLTATGISAAGSGTSLVVNGSPNPTGSLSLSWVYAKTGSQSITLTATDQQEILSGSDANQSWAIATGFPKSTTGPQFNWVTSAPNLGGVVNFGGIISGDYNSAGFIGATAVNSGTGTTATWPTLTTTQAQSTVVAFLVGGGGGIPTTPGGWTSTGQSVNGGSESSIALYKYFGASGTSTGSNTSTVVSPWVVILVEVLGRNISNKLTYPVLRPQHPLAQGLILALPFYECGNDATVKANDVSGYQPQAYGQTGGFWVSSPFGQAYNFNSSGTANTFLVGPGRFNGLGQFGAICRFRQINGLTAPVFAKNTTTGVQLATSASSTLTFVIGGSSSLASANTYVAGQRNFAGCSYDGQTMSVFLNGTVTTQSAAGKSIPVDNTTNFIVGSDTTTNNNIMLECLYVYNRPVSAAEVAWIGADPFAMFKRQSMFNFGAFRSASSAVFRKTLSGIGGRTGTRQIEGWGM